MVQAPFAQQHLYADHPDIVKKLPTEMLKTINSGRSMPQPFDS